LCHARLGSPHPRARGRRTDCHRGQHPARRAAHRDRGLDACRRALDVDPSGLGHADLRARTPGDLLAGHAEGCGAGEAGGAHVISSRFAPPTAALLALALVPTVLHSYRGVTVDDGRRVRDLPQVLNEARSAPTARRAEWVEADLAAT